MSVYDALDALQRILVDPEYRISRVAADPEAADQLTPYLVDWPELFAMEMQETDWLVEPLIARGRGHALYAGAKTGKSLLVLELAAALATGRPVLARALAERIRVLYLDYEMTLADLRERLEVFGYGPADDLSELFYALLPSIPPLDTDRGGEVIVEAAKALGVDLVVIDTTARAVQGPENEADTYRFLYRHCGQLLKEAGIAFVRLDHAGKDVEKGQRGSSGKNDDVDVVWQMTRRDESSFKMTATHRRMSWVPAEVELMQVETDGVMTHLLVETATMPEGTGKVMTLLDEIGAPVDISVRAARELLREAGHGAKQAPLSRAVKERKNRRVTRENEAIEELVREPFAANGNGQVSDQVTAPVTPGNTPPSDSVTPFTPLGGVTGSHAVPEPARRDLY